MKIALTTLCLLFLVLIGSSPRYCGAETDIASTIANIEKLPRSQRIPAYQTALSVPGMADAEYLALTKTLSQHLRRVSSLYGPSTTPLDEARLLMIMQKGYQLAPADQEIAAVTAQILINQQDWKTAAPIVAALAKAHPGNHEAVAWQSWVQAKLAGDAAPPPAVLTFPVHFCVFTRNPNAQQLVTRDLCEQECAILNKTFRMMDGTLLVNFTVQSLSTYTEIAESGNELLRYLDSTAPDAWSNFRQAFNRCTDERLRDRHAINFYIYDNYASQDSHGVCNSNNPYVLIDWERLINHLQSPEVHEMGHAFGLGHVGVPGATMTTSTNIMASKYEGFGSGGKRDIGFTPAQSAVIIYHAQRTQRRLAR